MGALPPDATGRHETVPRAPRMLRAAVDTFAAARLNTVMRSLAPSSRTITYILYACIAGLVLVVLWSGFRP
jgi:hypothetical protein